MDTNEVMRGMLAASGLSMRAASLALGRSASWLSNTLARPGGSEAATVAALAEVCGYRLALVPLAEDLPAGALVIDPPAAG